MWISGFGRIGRLVLRAALKKQGIEASTVSLLPKDSLTSLSDWLPVQYDRTYIVIMCMTQCSCAVLLLQVVGINDPFIDNDYTA